MPDTTEVDITIHADKTYAQLGADGAGKMIEMCVDWKAMGTLEQQKRHVNVSSSMDCARAMLSRQPCQCMTYIGITDSEDTEDFVHCFLKSELTEMIKLGQVKKFLVLKSHLRRCHRVCQQIW